MSVFLDTCFIAAYANQSDINHAKASRTANLIKDGELGHLFVSDYVFDEVVTLVAIRTSHSKAKEIGAHILNSRINIVSVSTAQFSRAWELFKKNGSLSFTDCTTMCLMQENNIKNLATFDKEFKRVKGINVIT
jgi:uncharacterized protein